VTIDLLSAVTLVSITSDVNCAFVRNQIDVRTLRRRISLETKSEIDCVRWFFYSNKTMRLYAWLRTEINAFDRKRDLKKDLEQSFSKSFHHGWVIFDLYKGEWSQLFNYKEELNVGNYSITNPICWLRSISFWQVLLRDVSKSQLIKLFDWH